MSKCNLYGVFHTKSGKRSVGVITVIMAIKCVAKSLSNSFTFPSILTDSFTPSRSRVQFSPFVVFFGPFWPGESNFNRN